MLKNILKIFSVLLLCAMIVFSLAFSSLEIGDVKCNRIEILYDGHQDISLSKEKMISLVNLTMDSIQTKKINRINAEFIEQELEKNETIGNIEVYKNVVGKGNDYEGILMVKVRFREPVFRVMSENGDYFIDKERKQIPVSTNYTANVLVATGKIEADFAQNELYDFVRFISSDEFFKAQIKQIHVLKGNELVLTPLVGDHIIEMGTLFEFKEKMKHLKVFYEDVLARNNWNTYKIINLKYKNQVIGTKRK